MGNVLSGSQATHNLLLLGLPDSGKKSLLNWWRNGRPEPDGSDPRFEYHSICRRNINFRIHEAKSLHVASSTLATFLKDCIVVFVIDTSNDEQRTVGSIQLLHECLDSLCQSGIQHVWLAFNAFGQVTFKGIQTSALKARYEKVIAERGCQSRCTVLNVPYLSSRTGEGVEEAFDLVVLSVRAGRAPEPVSVNKKPTNIILCSTLDESHSLDSTAMLESIHNNTIRTLDHRDFLRLCFELAVGIDQDLTKPSEIVDRVLGALMSLHESRPGLVVQPLSRTAIGFWTYMMLSAIYSCTSQHRTADVNSVDCTLFETILIKFPELLHIHLPNYFYTKTLLQSAQAARYSCPPNVRPLKAIQSDGEPYVDAFSQLAGLSCSSRPTPASQSQILYEERPLQFAFAVAKWIMGNHKGSLAIWQVFDVAHESYQRVSMRNRSDNPSIAPYSRTQLQFWLHTILEMVRTAEGCTVEQLREMSWLQFSRWSGLTTDSWKEHYTLATWEGIEGRMKIMAQDVIPRLNNTPTATERTQSSGDYIKPGYDLPPGEELVFYADVVIKMTGPTYITEFKHDSQAYLLKTLHTTILAWSNGTDSSADMLSNIRSTTKTIFWLHHILTAIDIVRPTEDMYIPCKTMIRPRMQTHSTEEESFDTLLRVNPILAFESLPFVYYNRETWLTSRDRERYIEPDRRTLKMHPLVEEVQKFHESQSNNERSEDSRDVIDSDAVTLVEEDNGDDWTIVDE